MLFQFLASPGSGLRHLSGCLQRFRGCCGVAGEEPDARAGAMGLAVGVGGGIYWDIHGDLIAIFI